MIGKSALNTHALVLGISRNTSRNRGINIGSRQPTKNRRDAVNRELLPIVLPFLKTNLGRSHKVAGIIE